MRIHTRLTIQFIIISAFILGASLALIYVLLARYYKEQFYGRLEAKAQNSAKLLIEVEEIDADLLRRIEEDNPVSLPEERLIVLDSAGNTIYSTDDNNVIAISDQMLARIRTEKSIRHKQENFSVTGQLYAGKFVVIAAGVDIYGLARLRKVLSIMLLVLVGGLLITSVAGYVYAGRALRPISRVVASVKEIGAGSLSTRLDEGNRRDEIARLSQTFNGMLGRLETSFNTQRNFIANASHEMRTPLTAISGKLELTLMKERETHEYALAIESALEDIRSLNEKLNKLLILAQANSETARQQFKTVRIDDILWQAVSELRSLHPNYSIIINFSDKFDDDEKMITRGSEELLRSAFINLMDNGCKYSPNNTVEIEVSYHNRMITFRFRDEGKGLSAEEQERLFEPFYRGKNAGKERGHGIGLSLVKAIVTLHGGTVEVNSAEQQGSTFTVMLPTISRGVVPMTSLNFS